MDSKPCTKCGEIKELSMFRSYISKSTGKTLYKSHCRKCQNKRKQERSKERMATDPEYKEKELARLKAKRKRHRDKYSDKINAARRAWWDKQSDEKKKEYQNKKKEKEKIANQLKYDTDPEYRAKRDHLDRLANMTSEEKKKYKNALRNETKKKWRKANPEKALERDRTRDYKRRALHSETLHKRYVKRMLKAKGFTMEYLDNNPHLIDLQRAILKLHRVIETLK